MMTTWFIALAMMATSAVHIPAQRMRIEVLDLETKTHMVHVVGFPGMITTIQLPDSFEDRNVLCGGCMDIQPKAPMSDGPSGGDARNWTIEKHARERSIHVKPAKLPTAHNPISAFSTNIFVTLDGGHAINISLSLYGAKSAAAGTADPGADAVVTLSLPGQAALSGRLQEAEAELAKTHAASVDEAAHTLLLKRLLGDVVCHKTRWPKPYRTDKTVVRVLQTCRAQAEMPTVWLVFDIENRGNTPLSIEGVSLEPETREDVAADPVSYVVETTTLPFAAHTKGIVSVSLKPGTPFPESWQLQVTPASTDRQPVTVAPVTF